MNLKRNIENISKKVQAARERGGHKQKIRIVAVTKTHPFSVIEKVYKEGLFSFGENRVQEAENKFKSFDNLPGINRRFIGHLQSNKVKRCLHLFDTIDSVHTVKLLKKISNVSKTMGKTTPVFLQVNASGEPQKNGFLPDQLEELLPCFEVENVKIKGLMTIGPNTKNINRVRDSFVLLRELKTAINKYLGKNQINELSMGMSGDFVTAIEEGSTMIRLGTILFGRRN
tara:strand:- start:3685 stop:4368 length:684 start_codon:yes stop_codon:yes gene_type:complete